MSLFDPNDYPSPADNDRARRTRTKAPPKPARPSDGYWHVVSTVTGQLDYVHRLDPFTATALSAQGSVQTRCDRIGRKVFTPPLGTVVHPCPACLDACGMS